MEYLEIMKFYGIGLLNKILFLNAAVTLRVKNSYFPRLEQLLIKGVTSFMNPYTIQTQEYYLEK